ncbi:MAG: hypothetical protein F6K41_40955 [Symploca sp. SIO3E6]|nr:hypothetical protein [Caldora sp. SIO3E6]
MCKLKTAACHFDAPDAHPPSVQLPQVQLFLASIPPIGEPLLNQLVIKYNQAIADQVKQRQAQGTLIYFVDLYSTISLEDLPDGIHPNSEGFRKMALAWDEALCSYQLSAVSY